MKRGRPSQKPGDSLEKVSQPRTLHAISQNMENRAARTSERRPGAPSASRHRGRLEKKAGSAYPPSKARLLSLAISDVWGQIIPRGETVLCAGLDSLDANSTLPWL